MSSERWDADAATLADARKTRKENSKVNVRHEDTRDDNTYEAEPLDN